MKRLLVVWVCLLPLRAQAGDELVEASRMLDQMNFRKALTLARKVIKEADVEPGTLARAHQIEGLSLTALGRNRQAIRSFRKVLAIDPEFEVSRDVSPKLSQPFAQVKSGKLKPRPILLVHVPPDSVESFDGLALEARLESDDLRMVRFIRLRFQADEKAGQSTTVSVKKPGKVTMTLLEPLEAREISYCFEALSRHKGILARAGSPDSPFRLALKAPKIVIAPVVDSTPPPPEAPLVPERRGGEREDRVTDGTPWYETWWFWTAVGAVVVAGAATGTALALSGDSSGDTTRYEIRFR